MEYICSLKTLLPLIESQNITHLAIVLDRSRNTLDEK